MLFDVTYPYTIDEKDYDEIIRMIAEDETPNRINADIWAEFTRTLEDNETPSVSPMSNRAMYEKVLNDTREWKKRIRNLPNSISDLEDKVIAARKALEEAERELERLKEIACDD